MTQASEADRHALYQECVQEPSCDVTFFRRVFRENFGREPEVLREDFCGTATVCCEWVRRASRRRAIGFDLCADTLEWGRRHNMKTLTRKERARIDLRCEDVRAPHEQLADVIAAQNYSFFYLQKRAELLEYFRASYSHLGDEGILVLDIVGGSDVLLEEHEDIREMEGYDYIWEQRSVNPITAEQLCYIHFRFDDGSALEKAFEYRWRLWTIPEAGFQRVDVYWEGLDEETGEGNDEFNVQEAADSEPAWFSYVVAIKQT